MNFKEKEGVTLALSTRQSSHFDRGINYKLNLASKILAEANIRIQDKIEEMERMKLKDEMQWMKFFLFHSYPLSLIVGGCLSLIIPTVDLMQLYRPDQTSWTTTTAGHL